MSSRSVTEEAHRFWHSTQSPSRVGVTAAVAVASVPVLIIVGLAFGHTAFWVAFATWWVVWLSISLYLYRRSV